VFPFEANAVAPLGDCYSVIGNFVDNFNRVILGKPVKKPKWYAANPSRANMKDHQEPSSGSPASPSVETFLLGRVDYSRCLELQQHLLRQVAQRDDGQIVLLVCEHPEVITVGRGGSPSQLASDHHVLRAREIEVQWVNRGGGCMLHCPGQLAIYPIVPLRWHDFSVGEYLQRLQAALAETLDDLRVPATTPQGQFGLWGRTGQLASLGIGVRDWVTWHGAFLNVSPSLGLFRLVETDPIGHTSMSSLVAERCGPIRMPAVRAALVRHVAEALGCDRYHLYTGHPWLRRESAGAKLVDSEE
jgi:lipoyl(octanoyl) transferase